MRRFVDSLLCLLVVYTLGWPLVRTFVVSRPVECGVLRLAPGGHPIAGAELRLLADERTITVRTDADGHAEAPEAVRDVHACELRLPGWNGAALLERGERGLDVRLPDGVLVVVGTTPHAELVALIEDGDRHTTIAVPSAPESGAFSLAFDTHLGRPREIALRTPGGEHWKTFAVPEHGNVLVLGRVD